MSSRLRRFQMPVVARPSGPHTNQVENLMATLARMNQEKSKEEDAINLLLIQQIGTELANERNKLNMYDQWAVDNKLTGIFEEDSTSGSMDFASLLSNKSERTYEGLAKTLNNSLMELRENSKERKEIYDQHMRGAEYRKDLANLYGDLIEGTNRWEDYQLSGAMPEDLDFSGTGSAGGTVSRVSNELQELFNPKLIEEEMYALKGYIDAAEKAGVNYHNPHVIQYNKRYGSSNIRSAETVQDLRDRLADVEALHHKILEYKIPEGGLDKTVFENEAFLRGFNQGKVSKVEAQAVKNADQADILSDIAFEKGKFSESQQVLIASELEKADVIYDSIFIPWDVGQMISIDTYMENSSDSEGNTDDVFLQKNSNLMQTNPDVWHHIQGIMNARLSELTTGSPEAKMTRGNKISQMIVDYKKTLDLSRVYEEQIYDIVKTAEDEQGNSLYGLSEFPDSAEIRNAAEKFVADPRNADLPILAGIGTDPGYMKTLSKLQQFNNFGISEASISPRMINSIHGNLKRQDLNTSKLEDEISHLSGLPGDMDLNRRLDTADININTALNTALTHSLLNSGLEPSKVKSLIARGYQGESKHTKLTDQFSDELAGTNADEKANLISSHYGLLPWYSYGDLNAFKEAAIANLTKQVGQDPVLLKQGMSQLEAMFRSLGVAPGQYGSGLSVESMIGEGRAFQPMSYGAATTPMYQYTSTQPGLGGLYDLYNDIEQSLNRLETLGLSEGLLTGKEIIGK